MGVMQQDQKSDQPVPDDEGQPLSEEERLDGRTGRAEPTWGIDQKGRLRGDKSRHEQVIGQKSPSRSCDRDTCL